MFSRKWKFEGSCTKKLGQKWKFAEMEIWVRIFCKRGRNGIPFYREWTVPLQNRKFAPNFDSFFKKTDFLDEK